LSLFFAIATLHETPTYREASANPLWQKAMSNELDALTKTHTWDLVDFEKSTVWWKWVCKIMTRANHSVKRYKTSLVVKGFLQEYGVDYDEAFALVAW